MCKSAVLVLKTGELSIFLVVLFFSIYLYPEFCFWSAWLLLNPLSWLQLPPLIQLCLPVGKSACLTTPLPVVFTALPVCCQICLPDYTSACLHWSNCRLMTLYLPSIALPVICTALLVRLWFCLPSVHDLPACYRLVWPCWLLSLLLNDLLWFRLHVVPVSAAASSAARFIPSTDRPQCKSFSCRHVIPHQHSEFRYFYYTALCSPLSMLLGVTEMEL